MAIERWGDLAKGAKGPVKPGVATRGRLTAEQEQKLGIDELPAEEEIPAKVLQEAAVEDLPAVMPVERRLSAGKAIAELTQQLADFVPEKIEYGPGAEKKEEEKKDASSMTAPAAREFCIHCGWEKGIEDAEPDDGDKLSFLQAMLGEQRFQKAYKLLGGNAYVVFRTLTADEADLCFTQMALDANDGGVRDQNDFFRTLTDYRLCLSLQQVDVGTNRHKLPVSLNEYRKVVTLPSKGTLLKPIAAYVYKTALPQEPLRRAVVTAFYRFQRLTEKLEARIDDPNFWPAIGGQP